MEGGGDHLVIARGETCICILCCNSVTQATKHPPKHCGMCSYIVITLNWETIFTGGLLLSTSHNSQSPHVYMSDEAMSDEALN